MTSELSSWARDRGWHNDEGNWYGVFDDYLFNTRDFTVFSLAYPPLGEESRHALIERLLAETPALGLKEYRVEPRQMLIVSQKGKRMTVENLEALLRGLARALRELGIGGRGLCSGCGHSGSFSVALLNGQAMHMCDECYQQLTSDIAARAAETQQIEFNYGRGTVGALLGGLVGAIPWLIVEQLGYYASICGLLIGRVALFGYQKAGGRVGKGTRWIIIAATTLSVCLASLVSWGIWLNSQEYAIDLHNFVVIYTEPGIAGEAWKGLGIGLLFGLWGASGVFAKLKRAAGNQPTLWRPTSSGLGS